MLWRETHPALHAIVLTLYGFSAFAIADTMSKWLIQDYSVHQVLTISSLIGMIVTGCWTYFGYGGLKGFQTPKLRLHIWRALVVSGIALFVVSSLVYIPLADFYGIIFLAPIVVMLLSVIFLKEPIGLPRVITAITGFIGVLIVAGPQFASANIGVFLVLGAMICVSVSTIFIRKIGPDDKLPLYAFYPSLFIFIVNAPLSLTAFDWPSIQVWCIFLLQGSFIIMGQFGTALGFARAPDTALVAPFHYVQILWGVGLGYLLFHDVPSVTTLGGSALIIGSGLYIIYREHQLQIRIKRTEAQL